MTIAGSDVLRLAGVEVPDLPLSNRDRMRLSRLAEYLIEHGYGAGGRSEAVAGDTVEIVGRKKRRGSGTASLIVRASARLVEARRKAEASQPGTWQRSPVRGLLPSPDDDD